MSPRRMWRGPVPYTIHALCPPHQTRPASARPLDARYTAVKLKDVRPGVDAYIGAVSRFGARLGRPIGRGSQVGHQPLFSRLQMGRKPVQRPVRFLRRLIEKQMPDHLHLLRGAELPPDDRQDEGFFLFQVIILGDAGQNDRAE